MHDTADGSLLQADGHTARAPALTCDTHFHVFGPHDVYRPAPDALYAPPRASLADYLLIADQIGVRRYVLVQPSAYGTDNRCMLDALHTLGVENARAVADIDETSIGDKGLATLHDLGVRAVRMHTHVASGAGLIALWEKRLDRLAAIAVELGWSLDFLMPGWLTEQFLPALRRLRVNFTIAHLGYLQAARGVGQGAFEGLLDLLRNGSGHCWIKLSGFYRLCADEDLRAVQPFVAALVETAGERVIWGSDYPHVLTKRPISTLEQHALLMAWVADEAARQRVLVENPARLYGFATR